MRDRRGQSSARWLLGATLWTGAMVVPAGAQPAPTPTEAAPATPAPAPEATSAPTPKPDPKPPAPVAPVPVMPALKSPIRELNLSVEVRHRYEYWDNYDFSDALEANDDVIGQRARLGLEFVASDSIKGVLQVQDSRSFGSSVVTALQGLPVSVAGTGNNTLASQGASTDLHLAYVHATHKKSGLGIELGRHEWNYGTQKVIGPVGWSNIGRAFDGARVRLNKPWITADGLWARLSEGGRAATTTVPRVEKNDVDFYGLYVTLKPKKYPFDLYWLTFKDDDPAAGEAGKSGPTEFHTVGLQLSKIQPAGSLSLEYGTELNLQFGDRNGMDQDAFAAHGRLGFGSKNWPGQLKLLYQFDVASGDGNRGDGKSETFQQLFPTVHLWHGYADLVARQNVVGHWAQLQLVPAKDWKLGIHYHLLKAHKGTDALYRANGAVIRIPAAGKDGGKNFGNEVDVIVDRKMNAYWGLQLGYCKFLSGDYLKNVPPAGSTAATGPDGDVGFFYLMSTVSF